MPAPLCLAQAIYELRADRFRRVARAESIMRQPESLAVCVLHHPLVKFALPVPSRGELVEGLPHVDIWVGGPVRQNNGEIMQRRVPSSAPVFWPPRLHIVAAKCVEPADRERVRVVLLR